MTVTSEQARIVAEITATMQGNIDRIETELAKNLPGFIHAWPNYGLGALINEDGTARVVCVSLATIVDSRDTRQFYNGANVPTRLIERNLALDAALHQTRKSFDVLRAGLAEKGL